MASQIIKNQAIISEKINSTENVVEINNNETNSGLKPKAEEGIGNLGLASAAAAALLLEACGGGGSSATSTPTTPQVGAPTATEAARFLTQATTGANRTLIAEVQNMGYTAWLDKQFAMPAQDKHWDWMATHNDPSTGKPFTHIDFRFNQNGFDATAWRKLFSAPDTLRQRVALALSEIIVVSIDGLDGDWPQFRAAGYLDLLEKHALGNYKDLLLAVSKDPAMGQYLTFAYNEKANVAKGSKPDENYARELMQLFTIGLVQLNVDGTPKLVNGAQVESYVQDDISQLARIFTGWVWDSPVGNPYIQRLTPTTLKTPMVQLIDISNNNSHETGSSTFLGSTVPAGLNGAASLAMAIDIIFAHPNVAPFVSRQLIQRLVTSNPIPAYVGRVAAVFNDNGKGIKGDLKAVIRAILLDDEARNQANLSNIQFGKVREPILRFTAWARAFNVTSPNGAWDPEYIAASDWGIGQGPLRAPSVFNFFRPGYVPPNSSIASAGLVAPELQLANETSVVGYLNYMTNKVFSYSAYSAVPKATDKFTNLTVDYSSLLPLAADTTALVKELNLLLTANQLSATTASSISTALSTITDDGKAASHSGHYLKNRIYAAILLVLAAPECIVSK
ncbi:MAG: DUF1800 domain-containing protein [Methylotenera sp.]|nr:DUF1800 domain-containing protein [Methylotenera sp.]